MRRVIPALLLSLVIIGGCDVDSVTTYPVVREGGKACRLPRITYKASFESQTVVSWAPGLGLPPNRLKNCTVWDKKNWNAHDRLGDTISMKDGRIDVGNIPGVEYTNWVEWYFLKYSEKPIMPIHIKNSQ